MFTFERPPVRKLLDRSRRRLFELFGFGYFSQPARYSLDKILQGYLPNKGMFAEVGANNGYTESNTYYLEKIKGWKGVLIEPIPSLYEECKKERKNSKVYNYALVRPEESGKPVTMTHANLMSLVKKETGYSKEEKERIERASEHHQIYDIQVPGVTFSEVLVEAGVEHIDFLSLDVEGYEYEVLKGLDFKRHAPTYILVECLEPGSKEQIGEILDKEYSLLGQVTPRDYLYQHNT